jgi:hypothetical protein
MLCPNCQTENPPQAHGTVHAWVGIVLGTITFVGNAVVIILMVIGASAR